VSKWGEHHDTLRRMAGGGLTLAEAASQLELSVPNVRAYSKRLGLTFARQEHRALQPSPHDDDLRAFAAEGRSQKDARERLGVSAAFVSVAAKRLGLKFRHHLVQGESDRSRTMATLYRNGYTLKQIVDEYGLTRERVRQIITKHHGLRGKDGGKTATANRKRETRRAKREAACMAKFGCTLEQLAELQRISRGKGYRGATRAFGSQRSNAAHRGIGWELTLWQWWTIWQQSGKWDQRGRGQGYVMCRHGDTGPYALGNVFIALAAENTSNSKVKKSDLPMGVCAGKGGTNFTAHRMIGGKKMHLGTFPTPALAHAAYLSAGAA